MSVLTRCAGTMPLLRGARLRLAGVVLAAASAALAGCMSPTPFGEEPEEKDLNTRNIEALTDRSRERLTFGNEAVTPLRFIAIGDTHDEYDDLWSAVDAINERTDVEFVTHLGDMTNFGLLEEYEWTREVLSTVRHPLVMTLGNHDAISSGPQIFREMYGPYDFTFTYRGVKFVVFNSNQLEFPDAPNRPWITEQVQNKEGAEAVVLVTHHAAIDSDADHDTNVFYHDLLRDNEIALWINGHLADFRLKTYHGVPTLQLGTFEYHREHVIVTMDRGRANFELCKYERCEPVAPDGDLLESSSWRP